MRAGNVHLNYPVSDTAAPFGGYKQSGNGREYGKWGLEEFLETKARPRLPGRLTSGVTLRPTA